MNYKAFIHATCEFFPCHDLGDWHSCLFCYCPLFLLPCPGTFSVLPAGTKDCSACTIPHTEKGWEIIQNELNSRVYSATGHFAPPR